MYAKRKDYIVKLIDYREAKNLVINYHYSKKLPPSSFYFGLFKNNELVGVCSYGIPRSPHFKSMLAKNFAGQILELNRLVLRDNIKNEATILISSSLKEFPKNTIVISYADPQQTHLGTIYQAANFKYYGLTQKKREYFLPGYHSKTIADKKIKTPLRDRPQKHRYIYILNGDYTLIKFQEKPYPKIKKPGIAPGL